MNSKGPDKTTGKRAEVISLPGRYSGPVKRLSGESENLPTGQKVLRDRGDDRRKRNADKGSAGLALTVAAALGLWSVLLIHDAVIEVWDWFRGRRAPISKGSGRRERDSSRPKRGTSKPLPEDDCCI
jgi:hypothetical protein